MKARKRRYWTAFLAAIFLSAKVAAAVELCLHDMPRAGAMPAAEAPAAEHDHGGHSADGDDCCQAETQPPMMQTGDCCPDIGPEPLRLEVKYFAAGASLETPPAPVMPLPYGFSTISSPAQAPPPDFAGPPLTILFRNFRS